MVVWESGGVAPGGAAAAAAAGMRPSDRRAVKIIRIHHAAVTFLSTIAGRGLHSSTFQVNGSRFCL
jgi:hypothetical protein